MSDDVTPEAARRRLLSCDNAMAAAELDLRRARDAEVDALHTYQAAQRRAMLSKDRPMVSRGGVTTAERDAWVDDQAAGEQRVADVARVRRESAADHLRVVRDQGMLCMALLRSLDAAYAMAGRVNP